MQAGLYQDLTKFVETINGSRDATILALDMGAKKVGIAKGSLRLKIATSLMVVKYRSSAHLSAMLGDIIREHNVCGLVVGLPSNNLQERFSNFVVNLNLGLPFIFEDESYSTKIANIMLKEAGVKRKRRNEIDDKFSAQVILNTLFAKI